MFFSGCNSIESESELKSEEETIVEMREFDCKLNGNTDCTADNFKIQIQLDEYPNCFITVRFFFEICTSLNPQTGLTINVYDFLIEGGQCQELVDDYEQANLDGTIDEFNYSINVQIWPQINDYLLDKYGLYSPITTIQYSISQCQASCFLIEENRFGYFDLVQYKINCGTECCQRSTTYTANANGGWDASFVTWNYPDTFCEENLINCPEGAVSFTTKCVGNCEELNGF